MGTKKLEEMGVTIESGSVLSRIQIDEHSNNGLKAKVLLPKALAGSINEDLLDEIVVDASAYKSGRIRIAYENDVVMKLTTPYDVGYVHKSQSGLIVSSHCVIIRLMDDCELDGKFLAYLLNSPYAMDYFRSVTSGAATAMLKVKDISGIPIPKVPMDEQKKLGKIFEAFSRKRVLLTQMLEAELMAENSLIMEALEGRV